MVNKKLCDVCGKECWWNANLDNTQFSNGQEYYNFCDKHIREIKKFVKNLKKQRK
jgi:hypothetical protein